jgi:hypothetical protein
MECIGVHTRAGGPTQNAAAPLAGNYGIALGSLIAAADNHSKYVDDNNGVDLVKVDRAIHIRDDYVSSKITGGL